MLRLTTKEKHQKQVSMPPDNNKGFSEISVKRLLAAKQGKVTVTVTVTFHDMRQLLVLQPFLFNITEVPQVLN